MDMAENETDDPVIQNEIDLSLTRVERLYSALHDVQKGSSVRSAAINWNVDRRTLSRLQKDPLHPLSRPLQVYRFKRVQERLSKRRDKLEADAEKLREAELKSLGIKKTPMTPLLTSLPQVSQRNENDDPLIQQFVSSFIQIDSPTPLSEISFNLIDDHEDISPPKKLRTNIKKESKD